MKNTIFSIHKVCTYKDQVIVAEKRSLLYTMEYSLIINNVKQDQIYGLYGLLTMHGNIEVDGRTVPVKVIMRQRIFTTKFRCLIDDEIIEMKDLKYEGF
jgi:hypothetical protein